MCLPTPFVNDTLDLSCLEEAAEEVGRYLDSETVVVRSTVIPGTTKRLSSLIPSESLVYNPEFLREAYAVEDFMNPHRIVIGAASSKAAITLRELYHGFDAPIIETDWETAEMAKLVSNAFLATKISFFNEIWLICQRLSLEMEEIIRIVALDKRIGPYGTQGGKPFGGKCLPKDVEALINFAKRGGEDPKLLDATLNINGRFHQDAS